MQQYTNLLLITEEELTEKIRIEVARRLAQISFTPAKELISIKEASELTGIALKTFYNLISESKIPEKVYLKSGKKLVFRRSELLQWFEKRNSDYVNFRK